MSHTKGTSKVHTEASLILLAGDRVFCLHRTDFIEEEMVDPDSGDTIIVNPFDELLSLVGATPEQKQANSVVLRIIQVRFVK